MDEGRPRLWTWKAVPGASVSKDLFQRYRLPDGSIRCFYEDCKVMRARCGPENPPSEPLSLGEIMQDNPPALPETPPPTHADPPLMFRAPPAHVPAEALAGRGGGAGGGGGSNILKGIFGDSENGGGLGEDDFASYDTLADQLSVRHSPFMCEPVSSNPTVGVVDKAIEKDAPPTALEQWEVDESIFRPRAYVSDSGSVWDTDEVRINMFERDWNILLSRSRIIGLACVKEGDRVELACGAHADTLDPETDFFTRDALDKLYTCLKEHYTLLQVRVLLLRYE